MKIIICLSFFQMLMYEEFDLKEVFTLYKWFEVFMVSREIRITLGWVLKISMQKGLPKNNV